MLAVGDFPTHYTHRDATCHLYFHVEVPMDWNAECPRALHEWIIRNHRQTQLVRIVAEDVLRNACISGLNINQHLMMAIFRKHA